MKINSGEQLRASNIIWNASDDYSFQPEFKAYDGDGTADIYRNYIIGAVHKYYNYSKLQKFFSGMKNDIDYDLYANLMWLGLENCAFKKGSEERAVLESMRRSYAVNVLKQGCKDSDIYGKLKRAHFQRALGEKTELTASESELLDKLEFGQSMNTDEIISSMNEILHIYFDFIPSNRKDNFFNKMIKNRKMLHFGEKNNRQHFAAPFLKRIDIGSAEYAGAVQPGGEDKKNKFVLHWLKYKEHQDDKEREYICDYFGISILPEPKTKSLEHILCGGNHKNCHLHFTRGEFAAGKEETLQQKAALHQRNKNKEYYKENLARNNVIINKLTDKIKNTMLVNSESSRNRTVSGRLDSGRIWRNIYMDDLKVFNKNLEEDIGDITVDILLDASASQINRQETIAAQGYIIAESLTRCQIPVRVYSFCNMRNYMVVSLFRDYVEDRKNEGILGYYAAGFNRDGLAVRTALHMMKSSTARHKILIVLSDGKPNDIIKIPGNTLNPAYHDYENATGVNDTAFEVRKGRQKGISILCVFTGKKEDLPSAKKIYGRSLVRIKSPEKFADMVGVLLQNELRNI